MLSYFIAALRSLLTKNEFTSGGLLLMAIGGLGAVLRNVPMDIGRWLMHRVFVTITIADEVAIYADMKAWLHQRIPAQKSRRVDLLESDNQGNYPLGLAVGTHLIWHRRWPLWVNVVRAEIDKAVTSYAGGGRPQYPERMHIRTFGRNTQFLEGIVAEFKEAHQKKLALGRWLYAPCEGRYWKRNNELTRPLSSVNLPDGIKQILMD